MKKTISALSILSASILFAGCGTTSKSDDIVQKKTSSQTTASITSTVTETTTAVSDDKAAETTTSSANNSNTEAADPGLAGNAEQGTAVSGEQNGTAQSEAGTASSGEQGTAFAGRVNYSYQAKYQSLIIDMIDAASGSDNFFIDYTLKDVTGDSVPELIVKHGQYELNTVITVYNSDLKAIGDMFRGQYTGFYVNSSGALAFATAHMGYFCASYPVYDAASDSLTIGESNEKEYGSADEIAVLLQDEGLSELNSVSISVSGGQVTSCYGDQTFDYPYLGIIV